MKHTPGPWKAAEDGVLHNPTIYQDMTKVSKYPRQIHLKGCSNEDARLIASAPELLEACKKAKKYLEPILVEPGRSLFWEFVDAIAKAEGGE